MIFCHTDRIGFALQCELYFQVVFLRTQDDTDRRVVVFGSLFLIEHVEIEIHLAGIFRLEWPRFQFKGNQRLEKAVIEQQIDEILLVAQRQTMLPPHETEAIAQFQDEILQLLNKPALKLALFYLV